MRILFLGPAAECRGFALAGVAAEICDMDSSAAALASARKPGSGVGLVLLSPSLPRCPAESWAFRRLETSPAVLVVPGSKSAGEIPPEGPP